MPPVQAVLGDDQGLGTDEVLFCETPIRTTRARAIADAIATLAALV